MDTATIGQVVGQNLRRLRAGRAQDDIARMLRTVGLRWSQPNYQQYEAGRRAVGVDELLLLSAAFKVSVDELLAGDGAVTVGEWTVPISEVRDAIAGRRPLARPFLADVERMAPGEVVDAIDAELGRGVRRRTPGEVVRVTRRASEQRTERAMQGVGQVERAAAAKYGLPVEMVAVAAREMFGRSLSEERDERIRAEHADEAGTPLVVPQGQTEQREWWAEGVTRLATSRRLMTMRILDEELGPVLEQLAQERR